MKVKYMGWHGYNNYGDDETRRIIASLGFEFDDNSSILMFGAGTLFPMSKMWLPFNSTYYDKVVSLCTGVENPSFPIENFNERMKETKKILNDSSLIGLRCEEDKKVLGFGEVIGDPFYLIDTDHHNIKKEYVAINIGQSFGNVWGGLDAEFNSFKILCDYIKNELVGKQHEKVVLFSVWRDDEPFLRTASRYTGCYSFICEPTIKNIFSIISRSKYLISYKLHALITALSLNIPVVPIEYRPKIIDVARDFGVDKYCIRIDKLTPELLTEKINMLKDWDYDFVKNKKEYYKNKIKAFVNKIKIECETR